jgi:hypothetical protein
MNILGYKAFDDKKADKGIPDELSQNYQKMDEFGKEELLKETEKILEIHKIGNEK